MYIKSYSDRLPLSEELSFGELALDEANFSLYTKAFNSLIYRVGNSTYTLIEFLDIDSLNNNDYVFWQVTSSNEYKLTAGVLPPLELNNFSGITIIEPRIDTYIGINGSELANLDKPTLGLTELWDVNTNIKTLANNRFALTFTLLSAPQDIIKDYFKRTKRLQGVWSLRPNATLLRQLEDLSRVNIPKPLQNFTIRASTTGEKQGGLRTFHEAQFSIDIDRTPEIVVNLDADSYRIFNRSYKSKRIDLTSSTNEVESIYLDTTEIEFYEIVSNENIITLALNIEEISITELNNLKYVACIVLNHSGIIRFPTNCKFENGLAPVLIGKNHIFTFILYNEGSQNYINVLHKAINIDKPQNINYEL